MKTQLKKIALLLTTLALFTGVFTGCSSAETKELEQYYNVNFNSLGEEWDDMVELHRNIIDYSADDYEVYDRVFDELLPAVRDLQVSAADVLEDIENSDLRTVHRIFMDAVNVFDNACTLLMAALDQQDLALVTEVNRTISQADNYLLDYQFELEALCDKLGLVLA